MISRLGKAGVSEGFLTEEREEALWHILYSISDEKELTKALGTFAEKNGLNEAFVEQFSKMPPFESNYAAYSLKAIGATAFKFETASDAERLIVNRQLTPKKKRRKVAFIAKYLTRIKTRREYDDTH